MDRYAEGEVEMIAWLSLGSNLQDPPSQLKNALVRLEETGQIKVLRCSSFYRTPPCGDEQQSDFINAVAELETGLEPIPLLHQLQAIENSMGRKRSERRWGPRLIDLDLLLYGDLQLHTAELDIPHPRMHERAFVLVPLSELDDTLQIPGQGRVGDLLEELDVTGISPLGECADGG